MRVTIKLTLHAIFALLISTACNKDDNPAPELSAPVINGISIAGNNLNYDIIVTFNEGVYQNSDKTGDLTRESFTVLINDEITSSNNYLVTHSASQKTASLRLTFTEIPSDFDIITIKPKNNASIYNYEGIAMGTSMEKSIAIDGTSHEVITITDIGTGTGTTIWTSNNIYILDGFVFVSDEQILTIEPGTIIKGKGGQGENASALIVARGGMLMANGTEEDPIIFTAEVDDLNGSVSNLDDGLWGGVIILGKATLNTVPGEQQIEGIPQTEPRGIYGGTDDSDNSGILRYVSIRHGGTDIGEGNEINGLTLGAVGSQTTIEYIEVFANRDDGVEIFGGAPRLRNILVAFCGDDSFDYDQGYHGTGQFWIGIQGFDRGDRLAEHDGGTDPETGTPYSTPVIYNVTYFGKGADAGKRVITFRDNSGGHYANSIFYNQQKCIDIEMLSNESSFDRFSNGNLTINNNIFFGTNSPYISVSASSDVATIDVSDANNELDYYFVLANNEVLDPGFSIRGTSFNISPTHDVSQNMADTPSDPWFRTVNYKGAINPNDNWVKGWTLFEKYLTK
jgi:hypothetical protein